MEIVASSNELTPKMPMFMTLHRRKPHKSAHGKKNMPKDDTKYKA